MSNEEKTPNKKKTNKRKKKVEKKIEKEIKEEKKETIKEEVVQNNSKRNKVYKNDVFKPRYSFFDIVIYVSIGVIIGALVSGIYLNKRYKEYVLYDSLSKIKDKEVNEFLTSYEEIVTNYYEDLDKKELIDAAIQGMVDYLDDTYSVHMDDEETNIFDDNLEGSYQGIGVLIQGTKVIEVYENSSAAKAGIKVNDEFKKIDGEEVTPDNVVEIVQKVKDSTSNSISVVVDRDGKELEFKLDIGRVNLPIVTSDYVEYEGNKIGYIKISSFTTNSYEQFSDQLAELENKKIEKLIIDLRSNNGGYLDKAKDITSLFVEKGKILYTLDKKEGKEVVKDKTIDSKSYDIVILVNATTASAAEVMAAALKDNNQAILVGETTYGKGKVQNTKKLPDGTILKYTTAKWLTPNGICIDEKGLEPDYAVLNDEDVDNQYEEALKILK